LPETDTWDQAVAENVERMLNALRQIREPAA
jgi:hypothetical protein